MIALNSQTIVFTAPGRAELLPVEVPRPEADQILVRLAFSTVSSGTERANLAGDPNVSIASRDGAVHIRIVDLLQGKGYEFVTVDHLIMD